MAEGEAFHRLLVVGSTGSGKTAQLWTLPGKKFAYIFDPNSDLTLEGCPNLETSKFMPEFMELDATLKGFRKDSRSDKPSTKKEPLVYMRWIDDINEKVETGYFEQFDWLCGDSLTFMARAITNRNLYINKRYGEAPELDDYKIVGNKLSEVFTNITSLPINLYWTGHISEYQDEKTNRILTQLFLPGSARRMLPLVFTSIWQAQYAGEGKYIVRTKPDRRGLQDIRNTIPGLDEEEDVTIKKFDPNIDMTRQGIGALLERSKKVAA